MAVVEFDITVAVVAAVAIGISHAVLMPSPLSFSLSPRLSLLASSLFFLLPPRLLRHSV